MKRKLLYLIGALFGVAAIIPTIGLLLPRDYLVVREIEVSALPEQIFPLIENPSMRKAWSPFQGPATETRFAGPQSGPGAKMFWKSPGSSGHIEITESQENESVAYTTHFDNGYPTSTSTFLFQPIDARSTKVVWEFTGKVPFHPLKRFYIFNIDRETGGKHFKGLENLKKVSEKLS